ncbi:hypothetical protein [Streptomyces nigrescens]
MATATVPAAVPDPNDPSNASTGNAPSGLFTSMLAAVDPARPATFDIPAPATAQGDTETPITGTSSASFHASDDTTDTTQKSGGTTAEKKGIVRAWLLAGAARWAKGGGAQNKRLELAKAKATRMAKEDRKVSVNRSEGALPGKGSVGSGAGKGGNSGSGKGNSGGSGKGPSKGPVNGQRNSNGNAHQGPSGRSGGSAGRGSGSGAGGSGGGGRSPGGGSSGKSGSNGGSGASPKNPKTDNSSGRGPKESKVDLSKGRDSRGGSGGGKSGSTGPAGSTGKNTGANGGSSKGTKGTKGSGAGSSDSGKSGTGSTSKDGSSSKAGKQSDGSSSKGSSGKDSGAKGGTGTSGATGKGGTSGSGPSTDSKPTKLTKTDEPTKTDKDSKSAKADKGPENDKDAAGTKADKQGKTPTGQQDGKPFSTKESRLTGYRDGTRAAKVVAHAKAYRDGAKDGWTDTTEAAERQKDELDKAHEERKQQREDKPVTTPATSADYHQPQAQPIEVKSINATHLQLGEGAQRSEVSRGEVRSLKNFERLLERRLTHLRQSEERTKLMKAHAEAQAQKATALMEATKSVKGGEKLIASLVKTADDAKAQAGLAEEIHKRAVRAADGCAAVLANAKTRYGGMYKAVVDSDEEVPGEMGFYGEGATTHG